MKPLIKKEEQPEEQPKEQSKEQERNRLTSHEDFICFLEDG